MAQGKKRREAVKRYDRDVAYPAREALELVKTVASAKFDETVEVVFSLGIDPKKADQIVRGAVSLPHGSGREIRVAVFCSSDKEKEAEAAGADVVGGADLVEAIASGRELDFDVAVATPDMMSQVGKLGRVLGPRGLMPNPKAGAVSNDVAKTVAEYKAGKIEYRNDRYGNIHAPVGKVSFAVEQLVENLASLAAEIERARPAGAKGRYMKRMTVSSTMGPGVDVDVGAVEELTALAR